MTGIKDFVTKINNMPAMPNIIVKALSIIKNETTGVNDLVQLISCDQALTTEVLKIVNSAYYGFSQQITSMSKALPLLGMAQIKNIILAVAMKSMITTQGGKDLWRHCIKVAIGCEMMASTLKIIDSSDAFVIGFLHDLGKMIMNLRNSKIYAKVQEATAKGVNILQAENMLIGCNHAEVGALLAKRWQLPVAVTNCIKYHHQPYASMMQNVAYLVYAVDRLVQEQLSKEIFEPQIWKKSPIEITNPMDFREKILLKAEKLLIEL